MNDRLVNDPPPVRKTNPEIPTEMEEIVYRALERDPEDRYATASEFATALAHPENVVPVDRSARAKGKHKQPLFAGSMATYAMMLALPVVILTLLMLFAHLR